MKGTTSIKFNQATMIEAVQMYLDAQLSGKHVVRSVKANPPSSAYNDQGGFEVDFAEIETEKAA